MMVVCSASVTIRHNNNEVEIKDDYSAVINTKHFTASSLESSPFHNEHIYVKRVTSLFLLVRGFGFRVLFDPNGRIYITLDPFYMNKVSHAFCRGILMGFSMYCNKFRINI